MSLLHATLIKLRNDLGYSFSDAGVCVLYAEKGIDACLLGMQEFENYRNRHNFILSQKDIPNQLKELHQSIVKRYVEHQESHPTDNTIQINLSPEEQTLFDVACYMQQGSMYLTPEDFACFDKPLSSTHTLEISKYAQPIALEKAGGRAMLLSLPKIYSLDELKEYIAMFFKFSENAPGNFSLSLGSDIHRISLSYISKEQTWIALDANQEILLTQVTNDLVNDETTIAKYAQYIFDAFNANQPETGFRTAMFCTGMDYQKFKPIIDTLQQSLIYRALTAITESSVNRITKRDMNLAWLAAAHGDTDVFTKILMLYKSEDEKNFAEGKPSLLQQRLDKTCDTGETALFMAAQNDYIEILKLLFNAGANVFSYTQGKTALSLAKSKNQTHVVEFFKALQLRNDLLQRIDKAILTYPQSSYKTLAHELNNLKLKIIDEFKKDHQIILNTNQYECEFIRLIFSANKNRQFGFFNNEPKSTIDFAHPEPPSLTI